MIMEMVDGWTLEQKRPDDILVLCRVFREIAEAIQEITGGIGVGVVVESRHLCMMMRGVQKQNSSMTTSAMLGRFRSDINTRHEFLTLIRNGN